MQWKKVKFLAAHGFLFQSIYTPSPAGGKQVVPYPQTFKEAITFVATYRDQAVSSQKRWGQASTLELSWQAERE